MEYYVKHQNGNSYRGELRGGEFSLDGYSFAAEKVKIIEIYDRGDSLLGTSEVGKVLLIDETYMKINQWYSGFWNRQRQINLSGEFIIFVDALGKELCFQAIDIKQVVRR